jgi:hypothetical protein
VIGDSRRDSRRLGAVDAVVLPRAAAFFSKIGDASASGQAP